MKAVELRRLTIKGSDYTGNKQVLIRHLRQYGTEAEVLQNENQRTEQREEERNSVESKTPKERQKSYRSVKSKTSSVRT